MGSLTAIYAALGRSNPNLEPIGFELRGTEEFWPAYLDGRPLMLGPLTLDQQRKLDVLEAAEKAREAQEKAGRDAKYEAEMERSRRRQRAANLEGSGSIQPDDVQGPLVSGELEQTKTLEAVRTWLADENAKPWLILSGSTGRGKTVAALDAIGNVGGTFVRARELARAFTARYGDDQAFQERCYKTQLLVIDDAGREADHALFAGFLEDLIDERPSRSRRTIVTTNLDAKQFAATYADERLRSRLSKLARFVSDSGEDMRRKK